ncbi:hypothetical protein LY01_02825 [Nonlabens xylanidelens]|uniref:Uncharacterized protein n=1 Tax=Nonlabens xylanidelens TaxID=191564 RepID=A0A2S6IF09_9FLAO|nr:hypothetical protein [Nonlabens xylanidelens]PPK92740.1 hypothetical protein LY01_02825 [Nonlabens xylanidelens]PQJ19787.1 hypothetical protein BST94_05960 [Nonlabens xylanidelens]
MVDKYTDISVQIEHYAKEISEKRMDFSKLRNTLKEQGTDQKDIAHIVKRVDKRAIRLDQLKGLHSRGKALFYGGIVAIVLGLLLPVISLFLSKGLSTWLISTPIIAGLGAIFLGRNDMRRY